MSVVDAAVAVQKLLAAGAELQPTGALDPEMRERLRDVDKFEGRIDLLEYRCFLAGVTVLCVTGVRS